MSYNPLAIPVPGVTVPTMTQFNSAVRNAVVEVNVSGLPPKRSGSFDIVGSGLTIGRTVTVTQIPGPYTGKGTLPDETEMDQLIVTGYVVDAATIRCYWVSQYPVLGNFKFAYKVDR